MTPSADPARTDSLPAALAVPAGLVADGEQIILAIKPGGFFVLLVSLPVIVLAAIGVTVALLLGDVVGVVVAPRTLIGVCGSAVAVRLGVAVLQWLARLYVLTDRRVIRVKGVLHVQVFECPLARVQNTFLSLSLAERLLGMGTIFFATAGTGVAEAAWLMINRPAEVHEIVVEHVRRAHRGNHAL